VERLMSGATRAIVGQLRLIVGASASSVYTRVLHWLVRSSLFYRCFQVSLSIAMALSIPDAIFGGGTMSACASLVRVSLNYFLLSFLNC